MTIDKKTDEALAAMICSKAYGLEPLSAEARGLITRINAGIEAMKDIGPSEESLAKIRCASERVWS